jgi:hypothetical protein
VCVGVPGGVAVSVGGGGGALVCQLPEQSPNSTAVKS